MRSKRAIANQNRNLSLTNKSISCRDRKTFQTDAFDPQNALSNCSSVCHRQGEWDKHPSILSLSNECSLGLRNTEGELSHSYRGIGSSR